MANLWWQGADGNWNTASNWKVNSPGGSTSANPPQDGDTVNFARSSQSVTTAPSSAVNLVALNGFPDYTGSLGTIASPMTNISCNGSGRLLRWNGGGPVLAIGNGTFTRADIGLTGTQLAILNGGTWTLLNTRGGLGTINTSAVVTAHNHDGGTWTAEYNATGYTLAQALSGTLKTYRSGKFVVSPQAVVELYDAAVLSAGTTIEPYGTIDVRGDGGTDVEVYAKPLARYRASMCRGARTITTLTRFRGSNVDTATAAGAITITNDNDYRFVGLVGSSGVGQAGVS